MAQDRIESESMISVEEGSSKKHYVIISVFSLLIISIVTAGVLYYFLSVKKEGGQGEVNVAMLANVTPTEYPDTMSPPTVPDTMSPSTGPDDILITQVEPVTGNATRPVTEPSTSQCSDADFANIFSPSSFDERTRRCLQSSYDYKWKCSCSYDCSAFKKSIRKKCDKSKGADTNSCCKYSYCKKSIRCSG